MLCSYDYDYILVLCVVLFVTPAHPGDLYRVHPASINCLLHRLTSPSTCRGLPGPLPRRMTLLWWAKSDLSWPTLM